MIDPQIKFARVRRGYDPQEVDAVFDEFQRQNGDLKKKIQDLSSALNQYESKISLISENTKRLEEERVKESLRITGFLNQAAKMAEQTEQEARKKADEIIETARQEAVRITAQARTDSASVRTSLTHLGTDMQAFRQGTADVTAHLNDLDALLDKVLNDIPADLPDASSFLTDIPKPASPYIAPDPSAFSPVPSVFTPAQPAQPAQPEQPSDDPYGDFVKNLKLAGQPPKYTRKEDKGFLGHFGE